MVLFFIYCAFYCFLSNLPITASQLAAGLHPGTEDIIDFKGKLDLLVDNGIGAYLIQSQIAAKVKAKKTTYDGPSIASQFANWTNEYLQKRSDIIKSTAVAILQLKDAGDFKTLDDPTYMIWKSVLNYQPCCQLDKSNLTYSPRFRTYVDFNRVCYIKAFNMKDSPIFPMRRVMVNQLVNNYKTVPDIGYQYLGTRDGITLLYPAAIPKSCYKQSGKNFLSFLKTIYSGPQLQFDPRERPWYPPAFNQFAKDIIIILDNSEAMSKTAYDNLKTVHTAAKMVANITMNIMTPADRIALVISPDDQTNNQACCTTMLTHVTEAVKRDFYAQLSNINAAGLSNYIRHFQGAINIIKNSKLENGTYARRTIILFLSGVDDINEDRFVMMDQVNILLQAIPKVELMAVGLGRLTPSIANTMRGMASDLNLARPGEFYYMGVLDDVGIIQDKFTDYFTQDHSAQTPRISLPFKETISLDTVISISYPIISSADGFFGVLGMDIELTSLMNGFMGNTAVGEPYAFLCDQVSCNTINHPALPVPDKGRETVAAIGFPLQYLDKGQGIQDVVSAVRNQNTKSITVMSTLYGAPGYPKMESPKTVQKLSVFHITPVPGFPLSVVFVHGFNESQLQITLDSSVSTTFFYHLDLKFDSDSMTFCQAFLSEAVIDMTAVKFAPIAFLDPWSYMYSSETADSVGAIHASIRGDRTDVLKPGVTDDVGVSSLASEFWTSGGIIQLSLVPYAVLRYIASNSGVFRFHPAFEIPKVDYDPTATDWFRRAAQSPDDISVSTPQLNLFLIDFTIPISKAIRYPGTNKVWGVVGMDVTVNYFATLLENIKLCNGSSYQCIVIDDAGYVVFHNTWVHAPGGPNIPQVQGMHLTEMEPEVAANMIQNGHMVETHCNRLDDQSLQYNFKVTEKMVDLLTDQQGLYRLDHIVGTNIGILVKNLQFLGQKYVKCPCKERQLLLDAKRATQYGRKLTVLDYDPSDIPVCPFGLDQTVQNTACHCSCKGDHTQFSCPPNLFQQNALPVCKSAIQRPSYVSLDNTVVSTSDYINKEWCLDSRCGGRSTIEKCHESVMCRWCERDRFGYMMKKPYCGNFDHCFFGQVGRAVITKTQTNWIYVALYSTFGVIFGILVAIGSVFTVHSYRRKAVETARLKKERERKLEEFRSEKRRKAVELARKREEIKKERIEVIKMLQEGKDIKEIKAKAKNLQYMMGDIEAERKRRRKEKNKKRLKKLMLSSAAKKDETRVKLANIIALATDPNKRKISTAADAFGKGKGLKNASNVTAGGSKTSRNASRAASAQRSADIVKKSSKKLKSQRSGLADAASGTLNTGGHGTKPKKMKPGANLLSAVTTEQVQETPMQEAAESSVVPNATSNIVVAHTPEVQHEYLNVKVKK